MSRLALSPIPVLWATRFLAIRRLIFPIWKGAFAFKRRGTGLDLKTRRYDEQGRGQQKYLLQPPVEKLGL